MTTLQRFGYFGVGLFFGIIILIFFLGGKRASCDYGPNARVLAEIESKTRLYSENSEKFMQEHKIDTAEISGILNAGKVNFDRSDVHATPCNQYYISGSTKDTIVELEIQNCDTIATIRSIRFK